MVISDGPFWTWKIVPIKLSKLIVNLSVVESVIKRQLWSIFTDIGHFYACEWVDSANLWKKLMDID